MSTVEGSTVLLDGPEGRYPYDGEPDNVIWPVTIEDFKGHAQISHDYDDFLVDNEFGGYLADAVEEIETRGQVSLIYQKRRQVLDSLPSERAIAVLRGPLQSITTVRYLDADGVEQTLSSTLYRPITRSKRGSIWFADTAAITVADGEGVCWIDMVCGFGITPKDVPAAWRQLVAVVAMHSYERRELASGGGLDEAMERVINRKVIIAGGSRRYV
jgi:uncharacterized phiE125 gp8 family phage protein